MTEADRDVEPDTAGGGRAPTDDLICALARVAVAATPADRARAAADLAGELVGRADTEDAVSLAALLRGNPRREATVWRALHFRLGDVSPSSNAPHDDPCKAVLAVARPPDGSYVASELVAVDADGSAWTALVRTDDELVVQVPSPRTLVGPAAAPDAVGPVLLAWRDALSAGAGSNRRRRGAVDRGQAATAEPPRQEPPAATTGGPGPEPAPHATEPPADLAARLTALEARLGVAAEEGARAAVAQALQDVHDELHAIREQLARLEQHLTG